MTHKIDSIANSLSRHQFRFRVLSFLAAFFLMTGASPGARRDLLGGELMLTDSSRDGVFHGFTRDNKGRFVCSVLPEAYGASPTEDNPNFRGRQYRSRDGSFLLSMDGLSYQEESAMLQAVENWERYINVVIPIDIQVRKQASQNKLALASARPTSYRLLQTSAGTYWFPVALVNQLFEGDYSNGADIEVVINSAADFSDFYYGLDGNAADDQIDFQEVLMHEVGHGLGFVSSLSIDEGGKGKWGLDSTAGTFPTIYDLFIYDGEFNNLTDGSVFKNRSPELAESLQGESLYFMGFNALWANHKHSVSLSAPGDFVSGSSISHLDEFIFTELSEDELMTPAASYGRRDQNPGPVALGVLEDMGFEVYRHLHLAQWADGSGITSQVVVTNTSPTRSISGRVEFYDPEGNLLDESVFLSREADFILGPLGGVTFTTKNDKLLRTGSAVVVSNGPASSVIRFDLPGTGVAGVGTSAPSRGVVVPVRRQGDLNTGAAIRNPGLSEIEVELVLKAPNSSQLASTRRTIPANGRIAEFLTELFPKANTAGFEGTLAVRALAGRVVVVGLELEVGSKFTTLPVREIDE